MPDYQHLARTHFPGLIVAAAELPAGLSWYISEDRTILIDSRMSPRRQQIQVVHMLAHLKLEHDHANFGIREELDAMCLSTQWILPPAKLANLLEDVSTDAMQIASYLGVAVPILAAALRTLPRDYWRDVRARTNRRLEWPSIPPVAHPLCVILDALPVRSPSASALPGKALVPSGSGLHDGRPDPAGLRTRSGIRDFAKRPAKTPSAAA
ncbi:ImmA/IrrE family metallo-endopeptidase [Nocardia panacis]|uniref:ImmA/IrrE family metallo-endopeptidase n=1 Tax=Nocardia panacis TaxID=2340916 RepID=UPI00131599E5|nr:ImmA/IrrE family metallo-endopeptidase [Nocardia panacis]